MIIILLVETKRHDRSKENEILWSSFCQPEIKMIENLIIRLKNKLLEYLLMRIYFFFFESAAENVMKVNLINRKKVGFYL